MKINLLLLALTATLFCFGQNAITEKRIEIELEDNYTKEAVIQMGKDGFVLHARERVTPDGIRTIRYAKYDSDLNFVADKEIKVKYNQWYEDYYVDDNYLNIAYTNNKSGLFTATRYDNKTGEIKEFTGKFDKGVKIIKYTVLNGNFHFLCVKKKSLLTIVVNIDNQSTIVNPLDIEIKYPQTIIVNNFQPMKESNEVSLSFNYFQSRLNFKSQLLVLGEKGEVIHSHETTEINGFYLTNASISKTGKDDYVAVGNFRIERPNSNRWPEITTNGMYIAIFTEGKLDKIKFYNFTELKNFFNYKSEKEQAKIEKKIDKAESKGKELIFKYLLANHPIAKIDNDFLLVSEAYYPTYELRSSSSSNGSTSTQEVFDGYQYTHSFIIRFDKDANIIWDQSMEMFLFYKPFKPKLFSEISIDEKGNINMVYANLMRIKSQTIDANGATILNTNANIINTGNEADKVRYSNSKIDYWHDTYFINYGVQRIKNTEVNGKKVKRLIYFVSKVKL